MKMDLVTAIAVTVVGTILGFFVTNLVVPSLEDYSFPAVNIEASEASAYATLASPDPNVFNYRALNPTIEVFVGQCKDYDLEGKCLDDQDYENEDDDWNEDDENEDENMDEDEDNDFDLNEDDEDSDTDNTGSGQSTTDRSFLEEWQAANKYTPTTTRPDEEDQENE